MKDTKEIKQAISIVFNLINLAKIGCLVCGR